MKFGFKFSNLCGTVYKQGNLLFTPDGNSLLSPVGNRITVFDLVNNTSVTLPFENRKDIKLLAISPDGNLLLSIDEDGRSILANLPRRVVLSYFNFKTKVNCVKFSPNGKYVAVGIEKHIQVWKSPATHIKEFAPWILHKTFPNQFDDVTCVDWSHDSRYFICGSKDLSLKIYSVKKEKGFIAITLTGHRDAVVGAYFAKDSQMIYSVSKDGSLFIWKFQEDTDTQETKLSFAVTRGKWRLLEKKFFNQHSKVGSSAFHAAGSLLVVGFANGIFGLYDLPEFNNIHTLSISQTKVTSVAINKTGEWLGFGCAQLGQLLVWEWQSESYVLKQQGHTLDMNCLSYSPNGQLIATGGDDGKVKLWNTTTGFCFVTFTDHTSAVSHIVFGPSGNALFSASLDGTVRAFDLTRYRNFRVMTSPEPTQFYSLALDPSGEIVCAGSMDTFEIFVWSVQTGRLTDILKGHEGPISGLAFNPIRAVLVSTSWDGSCKVWDVFETKAAKESLTHKSDVLAVAVRPDGKQICTASLDGQLQFWDPESAVLIGTIEGRKDIAGGRKSTDRRTAQSSAEGKCFTSVSYSADGTCVLAGGNSKFVCLYEISQRLLLKKFQISHNMSLDGILDYLNSKNMAEGGPLDLIEDESDEDEKFKESLPGVSRGDFSKRSTRKAIRSKGVMFSPTGRSWAAVTTEGLLVYSLDESLIFDPFELDIDITPENIEKTIANREYLKALVMSFRLNEKPLISKAFKAVPPADIQLVVQGFPIAYLQRLLSFIGNLMDDQTPHLEFLLLWCIHLFNVHGQYLKDNCNSFLSVFRTLQKNIAREYEDLAKICDDNKYSLDYLCTIADLPSEDGNDEQIENPFATAAQSTAGADNEEKKKKKKRKKQKANDLNVLFQSEPMEV